MNLQNIPQLKKQKGFTLIEMIVAMTIIVILGAVSMNILNIPLQQNRARDAAAKSNLETAAKGIESFLAAEGRLPATFSDGNPLNAAAADRDALSVYLNSWPEDVDYYPLTGASSGDDFICINIPSNVDAGFFKYVSPWDATDTNSITPDCTGRIIRCTASCNAGPSSIDLSLCTLTDTDSTPCL